MTMISKSIIDEFGLEFDRESARRFEFMISNLLAAIYDARAMIDNDELMHKIINPIASSISNLISIMLRNDDADDLARVADQIAVIIMDAFAD